LGYISKSELFYSKSPTNKHGFCSKRGQTAFAKRLCVVDLGVDPGSLQFATCCFGRSATPAPTTPAFTVAISIYPLPFTRARSTRPVPLRFGLLRADMPVSLSVLWFIKKTNFIICVMCVEGRRFSMITELACVVCVCVCGVWCVVCGCGCGCVLVDLVLKRCCIGAATN
jgi:hypothetical protein